VVFGHGADVVELCRTCVGERFIAYNRDDPPIDFTVPALLLEKKWYVVGVVLERGDSRCT
jgi:hypothetical protein